MWVFTKVGFVSVVKHDTKDCLLVRARRLDHLRALLVGAKLHTKCITETPQADYRFRVELSPGEFENVLIAAIDDIDYTNFKGAVRDSVYSIALHRIWVDAADLQARQYDELPRVVDGSH